MIVLSSLSIHKLKLLSNVAFLKARLYITFGLTHKLWSSDTYCQLFIGTAAVLWPVTGIFIVKLFMIMHTSMADIFL